MCRIHCPRSSTVWAIPRIAMAGIGKIRDAGGSSRSMYYNPRHAWGLPDEPDAFTPEEVAENTRNEDDLRNVLRPIQAFHEFYWVRTPRGKVDRHQRGYLDAQERPACRIGDKEKLFPWHLFRDLSDVLTKGKNQLYFRKNYGILWRFYQTIKHSVHRPIHWGFNRCTAHQKEYRVYREYKLRSTM